MILQLKFVIILALAIIVTGQTALGKGLVLGTLFSVINFVLLGETLPLKRSNDFPTEDAGLYMYQELAPVNPLVVSTLSPLEFYEFLTQDPESMIHLPAICFVDLRLGELATNPETGGVGDLPYDRLNHLRECLLELKTKTVHTKMVDRVHNVEYAYRMINSGIYIGNTTELAYFPLPPREDLRNKYYRWWRSANS